MKKNSATVFPRRLILLAAAKLAVLSVVVGRYFNLQVNERDKYLALSEENKFALELNPPERGKIRDRKGKILADNFKRFQLSLIPENVPSIERTLAILRSIYPIPVDIMKDIRARIKATPKFSRVVLLNEISGDFYHKLMLNYHKFPGLDINEVPKRFYPYAEKTSHVTGYVGEPTEEDVAEDIYNKRLVGNEQFIIGRQGMEKSANVHLRGIPAIEKREVNAYGRVLNSEIIKPGTNGADIYLTIDADLQNYIYDVMSKHTAGSAVVVDTTNGNILSMVSVPAYDCNLLVSGVSSEQWQAWLNDKLAPLNNRASQSAYPPGSTFKPMVALAALREGMPASTSHFCAGAIKLGAYTFRCWKKGGHGHMDMYGALRESCDVWFYRTALKLGMDKIADEARLFGLGTADELPLSGNTAGLVGTPAWKKATHNEPWYSGDTIVAAIGQGYMLSSPLQLAMMTAKIASGNLALKPHLLADDEIFPWQNYDLPENLEVIRKGLWQVVNQRAGGTAYRSRLSTDNFQMAGKTGTSQVRSLTDEERERIAANDNIVPWELREHALFISYAPHDNPRYAAAVIVDHGGSGSGAAAPVAKKIMEYLNGNKGAASG